MLQLQVGEVGIIVLEPEPTCQPIHADIPLLFPS
jgi:hypothetical protein